MARQYPLSTYLHISGQKERGFQTTSEGSEDELYPYRPFGSDKEKNRMDMIWDWLTGWLFSK